MRTICGTILAAAVAVAVAANGETIFEAKGPVTDKTPGFRFGNVTFTDSTRRMVSSWLECGCWMDGEMVAEQFGCG